MKERKREAGEIGNILINIRGKGKKKIKRQDWGKWNRKYAKRHRENSERGTNQIYREGKISLEYNISHNKTNYRCCFLLKKATFLFISETFPQSVIQTISGKFLFNIY